MSRDEKVEQIKAIIAAREAARKPTLTVIKGGAK